MITEFDPLAVYFGEPLKVTEGMTITQATLGDIIRIGEKEYWSAVNLLTSIPSDHISMLHDAGINYMEISELEFFTLMKGHLKKGDTEIFFGDLDFSKFQPCKRKEDGALVLYNEENNCLLDEISYMMMTKYLRTVHLIKKKPRKAGNKRTYEIQVEMDRQDKRTASTKPYKSHLLPMISSLVNHPGFKYSINQIRELTLYQFMDCVHRITTMTHTERIAQGYYSGNIDPKKINIKKELDWMRDLQE